jgi:glutamate-ammonia-ligase adenylyltransferase
MVPVRPAAALSPGLVPSAMPVRAEMLAELSARFPEPAVRQHLESFPDAYCEAFQPDEIASHLELVRDLADDRPVLTRARPAVEPGQWTVEVAGYDTFQFLSTVCNLLTVHGFSIVDGRIFTSEPPPAAEPPPRAVRRLPARPGPPVRSREPRGTDRRRKIVDVFRVQRIPSDETPPDWERFQAELASLTQLLRAGRHDEVNHLLIGRFVAALERHRAEPAAELEPLELTIDTASSPVATIIRVAAPDSLGFLSLTASALSLCGIRINQADVRTRDGRVDDVLWVTDRSGHKITAEGKLRELRLTLILIEHFSSRLPRATNPEAALVHFSRFAAETMSRPDWASDFAALDRPEVLDALARVLGESDFLWEDYLHAQPENVLPTLCDPASWRRRLDPEELAADLAARLRAAPTPAEQHRALQRFKDREIFRAGVRVILGLSGGPDLFAHELSDLAEVILRAAYPLARQHEPDSPPRDGPEPPSILCALGKLGGRELGFGSDLELMLIYDDQDRPGSRIGERFDRVVRALRSIVGGRQDGTFSLDFRLRPYGKSGPPSTSLSSFRSYFQPGGAAWGYERQALVKLRPIVGDETLGTIVQEARDQFVYEPGWFDIEEYRRIRGMQVRQLVRPGTINAKFSPGALVDVEYFVQALQMTWGGRDASLRTPSTLEALERLKAAGWLDEATVATLEASYRFFRTLIDALRVVHGHAKDLTVPPVDSDDFRLLARRMRAPDRDTLHDEITGHLNQTRRVVERLDEFLGPPPAP